MALYESESKEESSGKVDAKAIHKEALAEFARCKEAESDNRDAALDDLKFARLGEQWPESVVHKREIEGRPCMTFNRLPTFIRSVVNEGRQNKPAIKAHPADDEADVQTAEIINGLIRNIEYTSNADVAYDTGLDYAASCGFGYWRVGMEYARDDTFDMDLQIQRIPNPFAVYGDYESTEADSSDWKRCFVVDTVDRKTYEKKYKGAEAVDWDSDAYSAMPAEWRDGDNVLVAEYWCRKEVEKIIALMSDGSVVERDWLDMPLPERPGMTNEDLQAMQGNTVVAERTTLSWKVKQYIVSGAELLATNDWPGCYIPIVPVYGEELNVEGKRHFRSLIRDAKDAQRNFNYWRTTSTELVALAPKAPFIGRVGQFNTDADKWATANTDSHPYIEYDADQGEAPPQRQPFAGIPAGALQEALNAADDMKAVIGIYDAGLGARSNETSGLAINARKMESDTSTFHFIDNQARAIRHTGRILIDLIPYVYDKARIVRVMGPDKEAQNIPINQPISGPNGEQQVFDLTVGKYDLTVDTGPSFQTKREEAAYGMVELVRAYPPAAAVIAPHLAKTQDWPESQEIARELALLSPVASQQSPEMQGLQQQAQQMQGIIANLQQQLQALQADKSMDAQKLQIDAYKAETDRIKVVQPADPQAIQALVLQTMQQVLNSPDILPAQQPAAPAPAPEPAPDFAAQPAQPGEVA